jgi:DNA-binding Lrp family transcriptional regulator
MNDPFLEFSILDAVQEDQGNLTQRHISQKLGRSVASVNFALRLLAVKGYIKITGANPRNLRYNLTPKGLLQKSTLAYNFLKRQNALYEEVRKDLLGKLQSLAADQTQNGAVYGWTPFTESVILYLISEGIEVTALYVDNMEWGPACNRIPYRLLKDFKRDCQILILMEPLPRSFEKTILVKKLICYPLPYQSGLMEHHEK